jgi:hypothetical protein
MADENETSVDDAVRVITRDYYNDVRHMAKDLATRMKAGEVEDFSDALREDCDECQRVIYTFRAKLGLIASDNADAAADDLGDDEAARLTVEARMYYALQADILERLSAGGVDVNEPDSWTDIDLEGFDP